MLNLLQNYGTSPEATAVFTPDTPFRKRPSVGTPGTQTAKMEKEHWVSLQVAIGDSQRFLDLLSSLKWEDGLSTEAMNLIESQLATSRNSPGGTTGSYPSTADSAASSEQAGGGGLITVSMAKHAAESVAFMCGFAIAIVEYQYTFEPFRAAQLKTEALRKSLAGNGYHSTSLSCFKCCCSP